MKTSTKLACIAALGSLAALGMQSADAFPNCIFAKTRAEVKFCVDHGHEGALCSYPDRNGILQQYRCDGVLNQLNHDRKCNKWTKRINKRTAKGKKPTRRQLAKVNQFCRRILP